MSIPACYWNPRISNISQKLPPEYGNVDTMETELREKLRKAESMVDYAIRKTHTCSMRFLKRNFALANTWQLEQMDDSNRRQDVFYQLDQYIRDKTGLMQPATLTVIRSMKKHLASFEAYKAFLKDRMTKKIIPLIDLGAFKGMEEEVDGVFLDWNELSKVYHMNLTTQPQLVKYRDIFIVGCLTGFRFSDYSNLQFDEFRNGMLHVIQKKTLAPDTCRRSFCTNEYLARTPVELIYGG